MVREIVHPTARLVFDATKPDGTPRKLLDVSRLHGLGWRHRIELRQGIAETYAWYVESTVAAAAAGAAASSSRGRTVQPTCAPL